MGHLSLLHRDRKILKTSSHTESNNITVNNVHAATEALSGFLDTHASKVQFSTIKQIFFEIVTSSRNIRYIITTI